ncbi:MAG: nucleotide exchange factor GrpE [Chloroflexi bacterium]|nr:nucleotide exchange factor GrpE [Chloroflexota bacterium]
MTEQNTVITPEEPNTQLHNSQENNGSAAGAVGQETMNNEPSKSQDEIIEQLQAELAAAQAKTDDLMDKLQRTVAETQNSRRRQERQLSEELERASARIIRRLLPVVDDFTLAFQNVPSDFDSSTTNWVEGFRQIQKKLGNLLEEEGVTQIAADGEFDPNRHEAVTSEPHETIASGHIIDTLRTGYEYKGRVLRPSLVRVAL